jgi:hypothetical protein
LGDGKLQTSEKVLECSLGRDPGDQSKDSGGSQEAGAKRADFIKKPSVLRPLSPEPPEHLGSGA